jgi:hypothetical protein
LVDETARTWFARPFVDCCSKEQEQVREFMACNEASLKAELETFFVIVRKAAVEA